MTNKPELNVEPHYPDLPKGSTHRNCRGFTFIELMMTVAILAVMVSVVIPSAQLVVQREREKTFRTALVQIRTAIDAYKRAFDDGRIQRSINDSGYPKRLEDLVDGVPDQKNPGRQTIYFLRRIPRDPFSNEQSDNPADTWGKRSYASPPDDPAEGDDVFDVFSKSNAQTLNGIPLSQW